MPDVPARISEQERDTAVERLQDAYAEGQIPHEEMDKLLHQVLTAKTPDELAPALAALPAEIAGPTSTIAAMSGRIRRRGAWRVPRFLKVQSAFGRVYLDLSRAVIEYPVVDIELQLGSGRAKIKVPRDAVVDIEDLHTGWKAPLYETPARSRPGGPRLRISGTMGFGQLKVRHARR